VFINLQFEKVLSQRRLALRTRILAVCKFTIQEHNGKFILNIINISHPIFPFQPHRINGYISMHYISAIHCRKLVG